ncbi:hypothetical protein QBC41DRAFT_220996 [Cercophora samala]|uniref:Uncharacterized protein n=1 Tax=Cercophora samala TaxID=330535 RepID=A0AA39ZGT2_9PEZI|nr:hypothetical protein QBC41DRAFT_220996 [Cercophora samala]
MNSLGKLNVSGIAVQNENTLALVNINLDFSLWRCSPSPEYHPVGSALTLKRRHEAEKGEIHRIACKLGFLFHELIPETPKLFRAFGNRVSEILSRPGINPQGSESDGPFQPFIGADCTSIWAAATSGPSSIGVLLLACMLADAWEAKAATSIWVELVEERIRKVQADLESGKLVNPHTNLASQQSYTRTELASWDASARSWLRRAEASMKFQHTQFDLIVQNLNIPYPKGGSTYETVVITWTRAMEVLEKLLHNTPQQACDRAVLRGISAWNLFPNLLVFQVEATKVSFSDKLFPNLAVLSLRLEYKSGSSESFTQWSLALSHFKYYGDPVTVSSHEQLSRIYMPQLWLVALGALFRRWEVGYTDFDIAMRWFAELGKVLRHVDSDCSRISWLHSLCSAVTVLDGEDRNTAIMLVKYGWRRDRAFLGSSSSPGNHIAFFGLCNYRVIRALRCGTTIDAGIDYLRQVAASPKLDLKAQDAIITYQSNIQGRKYTEWTTIHPIEDHLAVWEPYFCGWLHVDLSGPGAYKMIEREIEERRQYIESIGENCIVVTQESRLPNTTSSSNRWLWWNKAPILFAEFHGYYDSLGFYKAEGSWASFSHGFNLWVRQSVNVQSCLQDAELEPKVALRDGIEWLKAPPPLDVIFKYIVAVTEPGEFKEASASVCMPFEDMYDYTSHHIHTPQGTQNCLSLLGSQFRQPSDLLDSFKVLEVAAHVYQMMPQATVSLQIIEHTLTSTKWFRPSAAVERSAEQYLKQMTRAELFACVAMFESGRFNIDPRNLTDVIALCSDDSLYVADVLLSDPCTSPSELGIRHLVGNIGQTGMVCLVSPTKPRIRQIGHDALMVSHPVFDGRCKDSFKGTSLHLSFTNWKVPLAPGPKGEIDQEIFLLESVVSVQEQGRWVADIDALGVERSGFKTITFPDCDCHSGQSSSSEPCDAVSIGSWEELLDQPPCTGIVQTSHNAVARLAAVSILAQQGKAAETAILGGSNFCWKCCRTRFLRSGSRPQIIIL